MTTWSNEGAAGGGEFDVLNAEGIEHLDDGNLGFGVEEGVPKVFAFAECVLDNVELGDIREEISSTGEISNSFFC